MAVGAQEHRKIRSRRAIVRAAADLRRSGLEVNQANLARRAGVSTATVRRHFVDPGEALLMSVPRQLVGGMAAQLNREPAELAPTRACLLALLHLQNALEPELQDRARVIATDPEALGLFAGNYAEDAYTAILDAFATRRGGPPTLEDCAAAHLPCHVAIAAMHVWHLEGYRRTFAENLLYVVATLDPAIAG
jgi:AcrR family transcriptional regulator